MMLSARCPADGFTLINLRGSQIIRRLAACHVVQSYCSSKTLLAQVDRNGFPVVRYPSDFEMEPLEGWVKYELMRDDKHAATAA